MIDPRLLTEINRGRCFALVGSGPSCEVGYPSWRMLAEHVYGQVAAANPVDVPTYEHYLKAEQ